MCLPLESFEIVMQSTVFSSILSNEVRAILARKMWEWVAPGGGILWYDFAIDNPRNPDVRGVRDRELRKLFPDGRFDVHRVVSRRQSAVRSVAPSRLCTGSSTSFLSKNSSHRVDRETLTHQFLPFALPDIGEEEIAEVVDSLRTGWITTGPKTRRFEREFAEFLGDEGLECIAVNSATAGLHLALEACGVRAGDEVITTPYTFTATAEVIRYLGAHPVFVDINPTTLNIDADLVERAITSRTRAIVPVAPRWAALQDMQEVVRHRGRAGPQGH